MFKGWIYILKRKSIYRVRALIDFGISPVKTFFLPDGGIAFDAIELQLGSGALLFHSSQFLTLGAIYLFYRQINQVIYSSLLKYYLNFVYIDGITFSDIPQGLIRK
jgi:hypothetical protein